MNLMNLFVVTASLAAAGSGILSAEWLLDRLVPDIDAPAPPTSTADAESEAGEA
jgi:hypothetical protein